MNIADLKQADWYEARTDKECVYDSDNLQFVIIPIVIRLKDNIHYIEKSMFIIKKTDADYVRFFNIVNKDLTREQAIHIENGKIIIPISIVNILNNTLDLEGRVREDHGYITKGSMNSDIDIHPHDCLTLKESRTQINIFEGFSLELQYAYNNDIVKLNKDYNIYGLIRTFFKQSIVDIMLQYIYNPQTFDYNFLISYSEEVSFRRIQFLKTMPLLYRMFFVFHKTIDDGKSVDALFSKLFIPKRIKKICHITYNEAISKLQEGNIYKLYKEFYETECNVMLDAPHFEINRYINTYINHLCSQFDDYNLLLFFMKQIRSPGISIRIYISNIFDCRFVKYPYSMDMKNITLGGPQDIITNNILLLYDSLDILRYIKYDDLKKYFHKFDIPGLIYKLPLIYGDTVNLMTISKQSKGYHQNIHRIQLAIDQIERKFDLSPKNWTWDRICDDISHDKGKLTFITDSKGLADEGNIMNHCVQSYESDCITGWQTHIASIEDNEGNRSTIEFAIQKTDAIIVQNRGCDNTSPSDACNEIGIYALTIINKQINDEKVTILKDNSLSRKGKFIDSKDYDKLTEKYKNELHELGYEHMALYLIEEKFKVVRPYLAKQFRDMTYKEASDCISNKKRLSH